MSDANRDAETLAQKIVVAELLCIMQRDVPGTSMTARMDEDERALFNVLYPALGISETVAREAFEDYRAFRNGTSHTLRSALAQGERNESYRRLHGASYAIDQVASVIADPANRWFGTLTPREFDAMRYRERVEDHMQERVGLEGHERTSLVFTHDGLSLGQIAAFTDLLEVGDYGAFYGFPIDDAHTLAKDAVHPLEVSAPILGQFMGQHYRGRPASGFLTHNAGEMSMLLFTTFISRAQQADAADAGKILLDKRTRDKYAFTRDYLPQLLISIFEFGTTDVGQRIAEYRKSVADRDDDVSAIVHAATSSGRFDDPDAINMRELQRLLLLKRAYEQITNDNRFTPSEYAMMDHALEHIGIRQQSARDHILSVRRRTDGSVAEFKFDRLHQFYTGRFFMANYNAVREALTPREP